MDDDPAKALENSFTSENTYETIKQADELGGDIFDSLIGIPVFSTIFKFIKLTKNFLLKRLGDKIYKLLFNLQDTTKKEREKFLRDLDRCNKEKASEVLLEMIDRLNNINKVVVLANLMKAKIKEKISIENFVRLCVVLERIPYPDLCALKNYAKEIPDKYSADSLLSAGVLIDATEWQEDGKKNAGDIGPYHLNSLGKLMIEHGLS